MAHSWRALETTIFSAGGLERLETLHLWGHDPYAVWITPVVTHAAT